MGFLSELKKLFFSVEAVSKSAAQKGKEYVRETSDDLSKKATELGKTASTKANDLAEDFGEKAQEYSKKAAERASSIGQELKEQAEDLGETIVEKTDGLRDAILHSAEGTMNMVNKSETLKKAAETTERFGEKILNTGEELVKIGAERIEKLGGVILGENHENLERAKQMTEKIGSKVLEAKEKLVEKAGEALDDLNEKIDDTIAKGKEMDAIEAAKPRRTLQETLNENKGSLLDDKDDFFSKAEKFAKGDYGAVLEGKITIQPSDTPIIKASPARAAGFDDLDGDGNEIIDDAIIDKE